MPQTSQGAGLLVLVFVTSLVGLLAAIFPVSESYKTLRPEFVCLLVIYWVTAAPQRLGVFYAWGIGMVQDLVEGVVWGAHGMALVLVAYVCLLSYQRIRNYSVWHQSLWVFILVGVHQVVVNWGQGMQGYHSDAKGLLLSIFCSAFFWPILFLGVRKLQRTYRIL